mgnify:CR=1 FL=1
MGGPGSGNWIRSKQKIPVSQCLSIDIREFTASIHRCISGEFQWRNAIGLDISSVSYSLLPETKTLPLLILSYYRCGQIQNEIIEFTKSTLFSRGTRWWFICPACKKRVGKLYLPARTLLFACRACHNLTHRKQQKKSSITWFII